MHIVKCLFILAVTICGVFGTQEESRYDNYRVYRVLPKTIEHVHILQQLEQAGYDFWNGLAGPHIPVDIMVAPHQRAHFNEILKQHQIKSIVQIENVQDYIDSEKQAQYAASDDGFNFKQYHRLDVINDYLNKLAKNYPQVKVIVGGRSYEGRNITGVHVSFKEGNRAIFLEGGIHAREWIAPATVLYLLDQLLTSTDENVRHLAENYDWYIFPSVNPDGYEYTHTKTRLWRKTRKPYGICYGADANRNWDFHWLEAGASSNPCSETYAGSEAFSETETKSLSEFLAGISDQLLGYIAFHSFSQLLLIPYGHTSEHLDNFDDLYSIGKKAAASLAVRYGTKYTVGNIVEVIYPASGGSMDWVKGTQKTDITYTYELRDTGRYGFLLPPSQIIPCGEEILDSVVTMILEAEKLGYH